MEMEKEEDKERYKDEELTKEEKEIMRIMLEGVENE